MIQSRTSCNQITVCSGTGGGSVNHCRVKIVERPHDGGEEGGEEDKDTPDRGPNNPS
jgi:hypothetical protein